MSKTIAKKTYLWRCNWPNGDISFVLADTKEEAIDILDEVAGADESWLTRVDPRGFMVGFTPHETTDGVEWDWDGECGEAVFSDLLPDPAKRNAEGIEFTVRHQTRRLRAILNALENAIRAWPRLSIPEQCDSVRTVAVYTNEASQLENHLRSVFKDKLPERAIAVLQKLSGVINELRDKIGKIPPHEHGTDHGTARKTSLN